MNRYITLPILFHTSQTSDLVNCELDYKLKDCIVKEVHFLNIDVILPFEEDNVTYSQIFAGGQSFYSTLDTDYVLDLVDESNASEFTFYEN